MVPHQEGLTDTLLYMVPYTVPHQEGLTDTSSS